jgi:hypothetical protein
MKTLEQVKDALAIESGYPNWDTMKGSVTGHKRELAVNQIAERYSEERLTDFKERLKQSIDSDITNREHFIKLIDNLKS